MKLLTIEINLDSFFDVNLIVFTTFSFLFSIVITTFLVFALRPLNAKARIMNGLAPEKLNITYLRLITYGFAELIAFITDIFLVIFGHNYTVPWVSIIVFSAIAFYKLVFVVFKDFRDLGFNAKGLTTSMKAAGKAIVNRDFEPLIQSLDSADDDNDKPQVKKEKVKYKKGSIRNKIPILFIFLFLVSCLGLRIATVDSTESTKVEETAIVRTVRSSFSAEDLVKKADKERELRAKLRQVKNTKNKEKIITSEFTNPSEDISTIKEELAPRNDTIVFKLRGDEKFRITITRNE